MKCPIKIRNEDLWKCTIQEPIERTITERQCKWIGHTLRKNTNNVTKQALEWNPQGHRKKGRPKNTWRRDLTSDKRLEKHGVGKINSQRQEEVESNSGRPMSPMGRNGLSQES